MWTILFFALALVGCGSETESRRGYEPFDANVVDSGVEAAPDVAQEAGQDSGTPDTTVDAQEDATDSQPDADSGPELIDCDAGYCLKAAKCVRASDGFTNEFPGCCVSTGGCGAILYVGDNPGECSRLSIIEKQYPGFSCGSPALIH